MKRTIEIEDNLDELVGEVKEELKDAYIEVILEDIEAIESLNWDRDFYNASKPCFADLVNEFADSSTPIYYYNLDSLWYLYDSEFEEAIDNAGIGEIDPKNRKSVGICLYLEQQGQEYLSELENNLEDLQSYIETQAFEETADEDKKEAINAWLKSSLE
jgi:predicted house-cleaning noncanonical NTP pyrophosphatase (MazG superfamily)